MKIASIAFTCTYETYVESRPDSTTYRIITLISAFTSRSYNSIVELTDYT